MALVSGLSHVLMFPFQPDPHKAGRGFCDPLASFFFCFWKRVRQDKAIFPTERAGYISQHKHCHL